MNESLIYSETFEIPASDEPIIALDYLADHTPLSKQKLKDAMAKGAVWIQNARSVGSKKFKLKKRLRRVKTSLVDGQKISIYYDQKILSEKTDPATLLKDFKRYSFWEKPPGMLSQGTDYGDHTSILRQIEKTFPNRDVYLIHRLDREAGGVMVVAHDKKSAAALSNLFQKKEVKKNYSVIVRGMLDNKALTELKLKETNDYFEIDFPIDGKPALTKLKILEVDQKSDRTLILVDLISGRKHQIRRHLSKIGFPVMGDPRYGSNNKFEGGLQLKSVSLEFICPVSNRERNIQLNSLVL